MKVRVRWNRHTLAVAAIVLGMWYAAEAQSNGAAHLIALITASIAALSWLHARANLRGLAIRLLGARGTAEDAARPVLVELRAAGAGSPCGLEIGVAGAAGAVFVERVPSGGVVRVELPPPVRSSGAAMCIHVRSVYPLGLFTAEQQVETGWVRRLHPVPAGDLPLPETREAGQGGATVSASRVPTTGGDDFAGLREWHPGDSPRHIDWRAAARGGPLMVKSWSAGSQGSVVLDWNAIPLEEPARAAQIARWMEICETDATPYELRLPGLTIRSGLGPAHRRRCLDALATHESGGRLPSPTGKTQPRRQGGDLRFETARQIDRRPLQLLCLILLGTLWPLHGYIASAGIVACALCLVWRGILRFPPPHLIARLGVIAAGMAAVYAEYGTLSGTEPGIAALLVFTGAKVLESRTPREFQVLALIGWFLAFCSILLENHLSRSLGAVLLILLIAGALVRFRRSSGGLAVPARVTGTLLAQALPLALVLFLVFPRGLLDIGSALGRSRFGQSGIDGTLDPGSIATLALRSNVAFRARFPDGEPPTNDKRYWRCLTLWQCDGLRWRQGERLGYRLAPGVSDRSQQVRQVIDLEPHGKRWIPALDRPVSAEVRGMKMAPDFDDTLTSPIQVRNSERIIITSSFELKRRGDLLESHREAALQLPATASPRLQQLVDSWTSVAQNDEQIVQLALNHLRNQGYSYTLEPGEYLGPGALEEFLLERKTGFCEHFSAAFATLMRMAGVPSRVVVGYLGGEYSEHNGGYLIIKQSDVHAWTEVWVERYGWYPIDPTAALAPDRVNIDLRAFLEGGAEAAERQRRSFWWRSSQRLRLWWDSVSYAWQDQVIDYDQETQRSLLERLGLNLSTRSGKITLLIASAAVALFGALLVTLWLRRPARVRDPWLRHWRRVCQRLARAGLRRCGIAEGPLAYAQYVAASRPDLAAPIQALAQMYIHGRYGTSGALAAFRQAASQLPIRPRPR